MVMEAEALARIGPHCKTGVHCAMCRARTDSGAAFRRGFLGDAEAACPFEVPWDVGATAVQRVLRLVRLGDRVEAVTRALGIATCGGCGRRKRRLNGE